MGERLKKYSWGIVHKIMQEYYKGTRQDVSEISMEETHRLVRRGEHVILLDVREREEIALGYIKGAVFIQKDLVRGKAVSLLRDREDLIVTYCAAGVRSLVAAKVLKEMGYSRVYSMREGFDGWKTAGYEIVSDSGLTPDQLTRYSRHILLQEVGLEGQKRLLKSKVLLVGAGGLGCPAGLYLAASGVGTLGIIDSDRVDLSNLQRQVLHRSDDVGRPKTDSARDAIARINPDVKVLTYQERLTVKNALGIFEQYDVIVDGSDNFPTKYLVNDAAFRAGKPYVFGGVFRFEGQVTVFNPIEGGPCLRCMFPEPPPPGLVPT